MHKYLLTEECRFGKWLQYDRTQQYRTCIDPDCKNYELRKTPKA